MRVSKPSAPSSGTRWVIESRTVVPVVASEWAAASTASRAITRYVVSLPPAIITSPGTGVTTVCSREIREVGSDSPESSGRSPAYTPSTSSWSSGSRRIALTWSST